jgi:hypothetical protein
MRFIFTLVFVVGLLFIGSYLTKQNLISASCHDWSCTVAVPGLRHDTAGQRFIRAVCPD